jgi:tartrate-resistant acid phosphatase type 5
LRRWAFWLLVGAFLLTAGVPRRVPTLREVAPTEAPLGRAVTVTAALRPASPTVSHATVPAQPSRQAKPFANSPLSAPTVALSPSPHPSPTFRSPTGLAREPSGGVTRIAPTANATTSKAPSAPQATSTPVQRPEEAIRIAVIGDYGLASPGEQDVANLVKSWHPDLVVTTGDNNYPFGSPETIDLNIGQFYYEFIAPYAGEYGAGAERNRFFPALGNHDWANPGARAYLDYFTLPGNERYYDVASGPVHLFILDSMPGEPDGIGATSKQATWLRDGLAAATEPWKLVVLHHPPFSSGPHGPTRASQWPFGKWGASAVLSGHDHIYERVVREGLVYFVNGLGGSVRYKAGKPVQGSQVRYYDDFGAMRIDADGKRITFQFITRAGQIVDAYTIVR